MSIEYRAAVLQGVGGPMTVELRPARDFPLIARAYLDGKLKLDELISRRIAFADINDGFFALQRGETIRSVVVF